MNDIQPIVPFDKTTPDDLISRGTLMYTCSMRHRQKASVLNDADPSRNTQVQAAQIPTADLKTPYWEAS
jgi:hypothetical protein